MVRVPLISDFILNAQKLRGGGRKLHIQKLISSASVCIQSEAFLKSVFNLSFAKLTSTQVISLSGASDLDTRLPPDAGCHHDPTSRRGRELVLQNRVLPSHPLSLLRHRQDLPLGGYDHSGVD